jgi:hypothetical protein
MLLRGFKYSLFTAVAPPVASVGVPSTAASAAFGPGGVSVHSDSAQQIAAFAAQPLADGNTQTSQCYAC